MSVKFGEIEVFDALINEEDVISRNGKRSLSIWVNNGSLTTFILLNKMPNIPKLLAIFFAKVEGS